MGRHGRHRLEHALTPAWSEKAEYDYVNLGHGNVANLGNVSIMPLPPYTVSASCARNFRRVAKPP